VDRPWLGFEFVAIDATLANIDVGGKSGLLVQRVVAGGPAAAAGVVGGDHSVGLDTGEELVLGGDIVTGVAGKPVRNADDLRHALDGHKPGDAVPVEVQRDGETRTVTITLQNLPPGRLDG
jgi:S1-C subfamily serine protease